jgi:undecaprenyl-diphosphatase
MDIVQIVVLALIQGAAELLPVSSSAHVITAARFMKLDPGSPEFMFLLIMLHTGTMFAVIVYFWPRWRRLFAPAQKKGGAGGDVEPILRLAITGSPVEGTRRKADAARSWKGFLQMVVIATAVTGVLGLGLKYAIEKVVFMQLLGHDKVEVEHLGRYLPLIAGALFAAGVLIIAAGFYRQKQPPAPLTAATSIWIGVIQGLCLPLRGFSRSGATISVGLFRGLSREVAEDFSFALAVALTPAVILYEGYRLWKEKPPEDVAEALKLLKPGLLGMACAFVSGLIALRLLSAVLERGRWRYFGYYCIVASVGVLVAAWYLGDTVIPAVHG